MQNISLMKLSLIIKEIQDNGEKGCILNLPMQEFTPSTGDTDEKREHCGNRKPLPTQEENQG